jgi:ABC-type glycerol-3-phosphate transport system substrate-binding protein
MKTIKMLFAVLGATAFLAACNNTGNNQQEDADTTYVEPTPPPNDTLMNDTMMNDTL